MYKKHRVPSISQAMKFFLNFFLAADGLSNFSVPNIFDFSDPEDVTQKTKSLIYPSIFEIIKKNLIPEYKVIIIVFQKSHTIKGC